MDNVSKQERHEIMSKIRNKNTLPEIMVRSGLHKIGYRFTCHNKNLPGKPDIVLRKYGAVIFINGCFWHQHPGCGLARIPKSRIRFWQRKLGKNKDRQKRVLAEIRKMGLNVIVVWECQVYRNVDSVVKTVSKRLKSYAQKSPRAMPGYPSVHHGD